MQGFESSPLPEPRVYHLSEREKRRRGEFTAERNRRGDVKSHLELVYYGEKELTNEDSKIADPTCQSENTLLFALDNYKEFCVRLE